GMGRKTVCPCDYPFLSTRMRQLVVRSSEAGVGSGYLRPDERRWAVTRTEWASRRPCSIAWTKRWIYGGVAARRGPRARGRERSHSDAAGPRAGGTDAAAHMGSHLRVGTSDPAGPHARPDAPGPSIDRSPPQASAARTRKLPGAAPATMMRSASSLRRPPRDIGVRA